MMLNRYVSSMVNLSLIYVPLTKALIYVMSIPHILLASIIYFLKIKSIEQDLHSCLEVVDHYSHHATRPLIKALSSAEDHRTNLHPGIDPIAMLRAIFVYFMYGRIQGASTIEQQLVRVVSGRYERTFARKLREQVLAILLSRKRGKSHIASSYLCVAFYGSGAKGIDYIYLEFGRDLTLIDGERALRFMCQLKYPRPSDPSELWHHNINRRFDCLIRRCDSDYRFYSNRPANLLKPCQRAILRLPTDLS